MEDSIKWLRERLEEKKVELEEAEEMISELQKEISRLGPFEKQVQEIASGNSPPPAPPLPPLNAVVPQVNRVFGQYFPTAVIRWMGKEMWNFQDAQRVLTKAGCKVADATIVTQLQAGKAGQRGAPAPLTEEQAKQLAAWKDE